MQSSKHYCVVDLQGLYVGLVVALIELDENGQGQPHLISYTLQDGESLVDACYPENYTRPRWNGSAWEETDTSLKPTILTVPTH